MKTIKLSNFGWGGGFKTIIENFKRHGLPLLKRMTFRRMCNLFCLGVDYLFLRSKVFSRPIAIKTEPANICNFRCPGCYTGTGRPLSPQGKMPVELYKKIVDETSPWAFKMIPYMWGEPLLHPEIFEMISYARKHNMETQISSNLNKMKEGDAGRIVESGLNQLIVPVDGATQESYEVYRRGGELKKVLDGIREILAVRNAKKAKYPQVELQYIVFEHNKHEREAVQSIAEELGVDRFTIIDTTNNRAAKYDDSKKNESDPDTAKAGTKKKNHSKCMSLWILACFDWTGTVSACCDSVDDSFGNINEQSFGEIWNCPKIQKARAFQKRKIPAHLKNAPGSKCLRCRISGNAISFVDDKNQTPPTNSVESPDSPQNTD